MLRSRRSVDRGPFNFRVSDVVDVPLRGTKLRLRLIDGQPSMKDLGVGSTLLLRTPSGEQRHAQIVAHASSSGRARQDRLDRTRELDVIVTDQGAAPGVRIPAEIGWTASGPV